MTQVFNILCMYAMNVKMKLLKWQFQYWHFNQWWK